MKHPRIEKQANLYFETPNFSRTYFELLNYVPYFSSPSRFHALEKQSPVDI